MIGFLVWGRVRIKIRMVGLRLGLGLGLRSTLGFTLEQLSPEQMLDILPFWLSTDGTLLRKVELWFPFWYTW